MSIEDIFLSPWLLAAILISAFGLFLILVKEILYWALGIRQIKKELIRQREHIEDIKFELKLLLKNQSKLTKTDLDNKIFLDTDKTSQSIQPLSKPTFPLSHPNESPSKEASRDSSLPH